MNPKSIGGTLGPRELALLYRSSQSPADLVARVQALHAANLTAEDIGRRLNIQTAQVHTLLASARENK